MIQISKQEFERIFPELEKIYNHSKHRYKYWEQTVRKYYVINDWKKEVRQYWKYNDVNDSAKDNKDTVNTKNNNSNYSKYNTPKYNNKV